MYVIKCFNNLLIYIYFFFKCVYTDSLNQRIFTTIDHSVNLKSTQLPFVPGDVTYKPDIPFVFVVHDKLGPRNQVCIWSYYLNIIFKVIFFQCYLFF